MPPKKKVRDEVEELFDDPEDIDEDEDEVVDDVDAVDDIDSYIKSHNLDDIEFEELDVEEDDDDY